MKSFQRIITSFFSLRYVIVGMGLCLGLEHIFQYTTDHSSGQFGSSVIPSEVAHGEEIKPNVKVAIAACGERLGQALTLMKSAILFSLDVNLTIEIISDGKTRLLFQNQEIPKLRAYAEELRTEVHFRTRDSWFPPSVKVGKSWDDLYLPCASQRLFLSTVLDDMDSVIYVDTDVLFLSSLKEIWSHFGRMNSTQIMAMAANDEPTVAGLYQIFIKTVPVYGPGGLNSGVCLMNLTRMRAMEFESEMQLIMDGFHSRIFGDQDILNIFFHYHPSRMYELSCAYNYAWDHCQIACPYIGNCTCVAAEQVGVSILHGRGSTFMQDSHPWVPHVKLFTREIYLKFEQFDAGNPRALWNDLEQRFGDPAYNSCFKIDETHHLLQKFQNYVQHHFST